MSATLSLARLAASSGQPKRILKRGPRYPGTSTIRKDRRCTLHCPVCCYRQQTSGVGASPINTLVVCFFSSIPIDLPFSRLTAILKSHERALHPKTDPLIQNTASSACHCHPSPFPHTHTHTNKGCWTSTLQAFSPGSNIKRHPLQTTVGLHKRLPSPSITFCFRHSYLSDNAVQHPVNHVVSTYNPIKAPFVLSQPGEHTIMDSFEELKELTCKYQRSGIFGYLNYLVEKDRKYILDTLVNGGQNPLRLTRKMRGRY